MKTNRPKDNQRTRYLTVEEEARLLLEPGAKSKLLEPGAAEQS